MLVVRRRIGEAISIGEDIEIEVIEISRTRVKLGIRAPREVEVNRLETVLIAAENRRAGALISMHGQQGVGDLLAILENICPGAP